MPLRAQLAVALATVFIIVAAGFAILGGDEPAAQARDTFAGSLRPAGVPPADFALVDQEGETVTLRQFRGTPVVVTFLYTTCEDTCPLTLQQIRGALDDLGHDVPVLAIAVDPPNDTAAKAKRFIAEQRMTGRARFLLGPEDELRRQWRAYGTQRQTPSKEHSGYTILLDRRGVQRIGWPADRITPEGLAQDLALLEREPPPAGPAAP